MHAQDVYRYGTLETHPIYYPFRSAHDSMAGRHAMIASSSLRAHLVGSSPQ